MGAPKLSMGALLSNPLLIYRGSKTIADTKSIDDGTDLSIKGNNLATAKPGMFFKCFDSMHGATRAMKSVLDMNSNMGSMGASVISLLDGEEGYHDKLWFGDEDLTQERQSQQVRDENYFDEDDPYYFEGGVTEQNQMHSFFKRSIAS